MLKSFLKIQGFIAAILFAAITTQSASASADLIGQVGYNEHPQFNNGYVRYDQAVRITKALYRAILFREAERAGVNYWVNDIMRVQGSEGVMQTAYNITKSTEFQQNVRYRRSTYEILSNIYRQLFNRQIDPSGLRTWGRMFDQGREAEALRGIVGSQEFYDHFLRY